MITADAAHCQHETCQQIVDSGGHYVLTVKDNQPTLLAAISSEFAAQDAAFSPHQAQQRRAELELATDYDKGHGRRERRTIETTTALNSVLARLGRSSAQQVFRITRQRKLRDPQTAASTTSTEVVFGLTSLRRSQANASALLDLNRRHWGIENRVHTPRDVTFGEDAHHARTRHGPQHLAAARNTAIALCRLYGHVNLAAARREFAWNPQRHFTILGYVMN